MSDSASISTSFLLFYDQKKESDLFTRKTLSRKTIRDEQKREDALMDAPSEHVTGVSININR